MNLNQEQLMDDVDCPESMDNSLNLTHDQLFNDIILDEPLNISNPPDTEPGQNVIRVVGDQEFILLQPGPSSSKAPDTVLDDGEGS